MNFGVPSSGFPSNAYMRFGHAHIWSTARMDHGPTNMRLFTTPQAQPGQGFTRPLQHADTNMKEGGRVPVGVPLRVGGVSWDIWGSDDAVDYLHEHGTLAFDFTQTRIDIAPLSLQTTAVFPAPGHRVGNVGFAKPTLIPDNTTFELILSIPEKIHGEAFIRVFLHGSYSNEIEIG